MGNVGLEGDFNIVVNMRIIGVLDVEAAITLICHYRELALVQNVPAAHHVSRVTVRARS